MIVKNSLKAVTPEEIKKAYTYQKDNGGWTFYQEREFMENLLQTRFNFLITVYALFVTAFFMTTDRESKLIILGLGFIIVSTMVLTVYRIYIKVDIILKILHNLDENQVFLIVKKELNERKYFNLFGVNPLIGCVIPSLLILSFIGGFFII